MDSSEILAWANDLEAERLPAIEAAVAALEVEHADLNWRLNQKSQELNDALAAQTVRLDVLDAAAYNAELTATMALSSLPTAELAARVYTDTAIQGLRDTIDANVVFVNNYLAGDYLDLVESTVATEVSGRVTEMNQLLGEAAAIENRVNAATDAMMVAVNNLVNTELPALAGEVSTNTSDTQNLNALITTLMTDFSETTFQAGLDAIRASAEKSISPMRTAVLREPRSLWGRNLSAPSTTLAKATLGGYGTFLTDDVEFAECFVFGVGDDENIGSAFPLEFSNEKIYKVSVTVRCLDDGVGSTGVDLWIGATTTKSVTVIEPDVELKITTTPLMVANGVQTYDIYVSGNTAAMDDYGIAVEERIELVGSATANKIYTHLRQNKESLTAGQAALATFTVTDVSEVLLRILSAESLIQASLDQAEVARIAAETAQSSAETAKIDAVAAMTNAAGSASAAASSATLASESATEAGNQATSSANSATSASTAATTAGTYASTAETEALNAQTSAGAASVSSAAAATSATNAQNSATSASASETVAANILANITNTETGFAGEILSIKALDLSALAGTALGTFLTQLDVAADGTSATVTEQAAAITNINGNAAASYVLRLSAGGAEAGLELVAADDPIGGTATSFRVDAANIILNGSVVADQIAANTITGDKIVVSTIDVTDINVGQMNAQHLIVTENLSIDDANAGFSFGKSSASDQSVEGIYIGRMQKLDTTLGFGFLMGAVNGGIEQAIRHTSDDGLVITNADFELITTTPADPTDYSTAQTIDLPVGTYSINIEMVGGGGGGGGADYRVGFGGSTVAGTPGSPGTESRVELWDGETYTGVAWTAAGGLGGAKGGRTTSSSAVGGKGANSSFGSGGAGAYSDLVYVGYTSDNGEQYDAVYYDAADGGFGAGGGGSQGNSPTPSGGGASVTVTVNRYIVQSLSAPKLVFTPGTGGAAGTGGPTNPGAGGGGKLRVSTSSAKPTPAGVITKKPTITGTFAKGTVASETVFPDLGKGMWVIWDTGTSQLDITTLEVSDTGETVRLSKAYLATFVANKRPNIVANGSNNRTLGYAFYPMGG